ncbi:LOW QUALITY PROTEIN: hypothetical protein PHMEG_0009257 [Phytophthora megakarya]|uniref:Uncharacterized protein n=1 Tax=Phytophthora megakarya TaxID=4795 RepID=A0A225WIQ1_9STRA|nr:LOW QUALITY PROTEIN: hypothetical protein PHMEG_0009257 [Phytophthora megakarya]
MLAFEGYLHKYAGIYEQDHSKDDTSPSMLGFMGDTGLVNEAVVRRGVCPRVVFPEEKVDDSQLSRLFARPSFVWIPEYQNGKGIPSCINRSCQSKPSVKKYGRRVVELVECKCDLLLVKYRCGIAQQSFSTLSTEYFKQWPEMILHFPFVLSHKLVFSKTFFVMALRHNSMMANIERRRRQRYYKLVSLFACGVKRNHASTCGYLAPMPVTEDQYMEQNKLVDNHTLTKAWLHATELCGSLCEQVMKHCVVKRVMRMDHSVKFCKRLKLWKAHGQREYLTDAKIGNRKKTTILSSLRLCKLCVYWN